MLPAKYLDGHAVLAIPAYMVNQLKSNDEPDLESLPNKEARLVNQNNSTLEAANSRELCGV